MDDARKLLDSLMGQTRNMDVKEAKKKKGQNFKEENVCKFYLLGFCPQHENLFKNTKRHLGDCEKIHSEALRDEFEAHPDKEEYEVKYLRDLVRKLESVVRTADDAVNRQKRAIEQANKELIEKGPNDVAKQEIVKIRENCNILLAQAEELAEKGDIEGSKAKQAQFEQTKAIADDYEQKSCAPIKEEVCEICGLRPEDGDGMRKFSHTEGKIHIGFMRVREALLKFTEKQQKMEEKLGRSSKSDRKDDFERERDRDRGRDRDRDRGRDRDQPPEREGRSAAGAEGLAEGAAPDRGAERSRRRDGNREPRDAGERDYKAGGDGAQSYDDSNNDRRRGGDRRGGDRRGGGGGRGERGDRGGYDDYGYSRRGGNDRDHKDRERGERRSDAGNGPGYGYGYGREHASDRRQRSRSRDQRRY